MPFDREQIIKSVCYLQSETRFSYLCLISKFAFLDKCDGALKHWSYRTNFPALSISDGAKKSIVSYQQMNLLIEDNRLYYIVYLPTGCCTKRKTIFWKEFFLLYYLTLSDATYY